MASQNAPSPSQASKPVVPKTKVKTTWPSVPPNADRTPIRTERLLLRPFEAADVEAVYELRQQPEVMIFTLSGIIDGDISESRTFVERFLPPKDTATYNFVAVYLGDDDKSGNADAKGVVIGVGGAHKTTPHLGWPEVGYMFRKEYWNKGFATEFLRAFSKAWWALPRTDVEIEVPTASVEGRGGDKTAENDGDVIEVQELLTAIIDANNIGSRRVLEKAGFKEYIQWKEPDSRAGFEGLDVTLASFLLTAPES
ncbi:acetyltransferase domain-containing protein [Hypoxylon argillaceum]|nr:acetyltransferase domain-containing protein [Hypoxylon argillaceum]KAI1147387.1 acetyltransferase domain-containing protein [Nemania diffusa]